MEVLGERPVWSMSGGEMVSSLDATYAEIARLETFALLLIAGLETTGYPQELGAGTTARFLSFRYRVDAAKARRDVHLATHLPKYPAVAAALPDVQPEQAAIAEVAYDNATDGDAAEDASVLGAVPGATVLLHPAQAGAIVAALDKVPTTVPPDDVRVAEQQLVELGRTHGPLQLRDAGKLIRDRVDTDGPEPAEQKAYDRESLRLKNADNGVAFTGYLANENAELFRTLIHAHAKPHKTVDGALDPRGRDKRQADALTTLLNAANNPTGHHRTSSAEAPCIRDDRGVADSATGKCATGKCATGKCATGNCAASDGATGECATGDGATGEAATGHNAGSGGGAAGSGGSATGFIPGHGPKAHITVTIDFNDLKAATADKIGHLIYGDALSAATIRRLACDAQILPIVLGSNSQPLDVGTTVRLATGPMRKALIARDKGCVCCGAPPIYCDAHHVLSWIDGGETKITNLVLLCKRCHRDLHAGHWDIQISNGVVHVARPTWATPDPIPRGRYRPPTTRPPRETESTDGAPNRAWPRDADPPWITTDETARLNPWGDAPGQPIGDVPQRPRSAASNARSDALAQWSGDVRQRSHNAAIDPWDDAPEQPSRDVRQPSHSPAVDPWGDTLDQPLDRDRKQQSRGQHRWSLREPEASLRSAYGFDPWGEVTDGAPRGLLRESANERPAPADVDVWGDAVTPDPNDERRRKPGAPPDDAVDPWGGPGTEAADDLDPARDDPHPNHRAADLSSESKRPPDAIATTAA
jgi:hypothetical protein